MTANTQLVVEWLKEHRCSKPQMDDFEQCFAALCRAGTISVDLSKIGEGNKIISGYELRMSPILDRILTPVTVTAAQKKQKEIDSMSADEFKQATPELHDTRISPVFKSTNGQGDRHVGELPSGI